MAEATTFYSDVVVMISDALIMAEPRLSRATSHNGPRMRRNPRNPRQFGSTSKITSNNGQEAWLWSRPQIRPVLPRKYPVTFSLRPPKRQGNAAYQAVTMAQKRLGLLLPAQPFSSGSTHP
jgi:hypothetical protein